MKKQQQKNRNSNADRTLEETPSTSNIRSALKISPQPRFMPMCEHPETESSGEYCKDLPCRESSANKESSIKHSTEK